MNRAFAILTKVLCLLLLLPSVALAGPCVGEPIRIIHIDIRTCVPFEVSAVNRFLKGRPWNSEFCQYWVSKHPALLLTGVLIKDRIRRLEQQPRKGWKEKLTPWRNLERGTQIIVVLPREEGFSCAELKDQQQFFVDEDCTCESSSPFCEIDRTEAITGSVVRGEGKRWTQDQILN